MNTLLCSHPGKFGDLLWALPTIRAIQEANPEMAIDLSIPPGLESIGPLLDRQPYIRNIYVERGWDVQDTAPRTPRFPARMEKAPWHIALGYTGWPKDPLPQEIYRTVCAEHPERPIAPLDLDRPWITSSFVMRGYPHPVAVGFTDEYFELKVGIVELLNLAALRSGLRIDDHDSGRYAVYCSARPGSRWVREWDAAECDWLEAAEVIARAKVFLGCCSALHVLAVALGKPCVILEPNPHRHHPIFYPLGTEGRVKLVRGTDGLPTFDARHCAEAIEEVLGG